MDCYQEILARLYAEHKDELYSLLNDKEKKQVEKLALKPNIPSSHVLILSPASENSCSEGHGIKQGAFWVDEE